MRVRFVIIAALGLALGGCKGSSESGDPAASSSSTEGQQGAEGKKDDTPVADTPTEVTVYSGRGEPLVSKVLAAFEKDSGIKVKVKYAGTEELAATVLEEGARSPADVFLAQDVSTLGVLQDQGAFAKLPDAILSRVGKSAKSPEGFWVGVTGRARVLAYNKTKLKPEDLPKSSAELTDKKWQSKVGWAPANASFKSSLSAMIQLDGKEAAAAWVAAMQKNDTKPYPKNTPAVEAVSRGEIDVALVNHYYLYRLRAEKGEDYPVENHYFRSGKADSLVNVSGAAMLKTSKNQEAAEKLITYLLSDKAQQQFTAQNYEFPLVPGIKTPLGLPDIATLEAPVVDLFKLKDLAGANEILRAANALP